MTLLKRACVAGLLLGSFVLVGCGVGGPMDSDTNYTESSQKPMTTEATRVAPAPKKILQAPTTKKVTPVKALAGPRIQDPNNKILANPNPLHPNGRWLGKFLPEAGDEFEMELTLNVKKTALVLPKPQPTNNFWSNWSLFRKAHACGPYTPPVIHPLSGAFRIRSPYPEKRNETLSGTAQSYDAFRYSSTVRLKIGEEWQSTARVIRDANTKRLQLHGNIYKIVDKKYKRVARFLLNKM